MDFVLTKKEHRQSIQNVKAIPGEFPHALVVVDIDKRRISNAVIKTSLLKDVNEDHE